MIYILINEKFLHSLFYPLYHIKNILLQIQRNNNAIKIIVDEKISETISYSYSYTDFYPCLFVYYTKFMNIKLNRYVFQIWVSNISNKIEFRLLEGHQDGITITPQNSFHWINFQNIVQNC